MASTQQLLLGEGAGGAEKNYIEDVFSTYLYTGNGSGLTIENGIALGNSGFGKSVAFNGTTDYLSKSSDLTGATDGKTFTFSAWVYITGTGSDYRVYHSNDTGSGWPRFAVYVNCSSTSSATVNFVGAPTDGTIRLNVSSPVGAFGRNGWNHILVSFDMASQANSKMYINDISVTPTFSTFQDVSISFANNEHYVGAESASAGKVEGRLSNVYLDYTYRDLATESNRRLFRTSDGQPATGQASLSPILYMPLDGTTANTGVNLGTGGNFTVNGSPTVLTTDGPFLASGVGKGGMVWIKSRNNAVAHDLFDTSRGVGRILQSSNTAAQAYTADTQKTLTAFNTDGFSLGTDSGNWGANFSGYTYASWTFRKQPKFFDIVTYTGNDTTQNIAHSLGSTPGCVIVKCTNAAAGWYVWHRGQTAGYYSILNTTAAQTNGSSVNTFGNNTTYVDPTSTQFTVGSNGNINQTGNTYVAYIFAHDAGGFGLTGTDNVISCGSMVAPSTGSEVNLGWEPQWILYKPATSTGGDWRIVDNMRGFPASVGGFYDSFLVPNTSAAETTNDDIYIRPNGFMWNAGTSKTIIYIAIRRGPMKVPTDGTKVYNALAYSGSGTDTQRTMGFTPDYFGALIRSTTQQIGGEINGVRLTGSAYRATGSISADDQLGAVSDYFRWDNMTGMSLKAYQGLNASGYTYVAHSFKRAPSFFDVVCYYGAGAGVTNTLTHNLGVAPELIITKSRNDVSNWLTYTQSLGSNTYLLLNGTDAAETYANWMLATSTTFTVKNLNNTGGLTYVAYLFATCAGVSKVGNYTGTGTTKQVDCGFAAGARFVLVKATSTTGNWIVVDTARGLVSGNDPTLLLNSTAAEVTTNDWFDPYSAGFELSSAGGNLANTNGVSYIFLAIA